MANPSVRAYTKKSATKAASFTVTNPAGLTAGDLLVLAACSTTAPPSAAPSGFTQQAQGLTSGGYAVTIYSKVATAADVSAGSVTVANSAASYQQCMLWAVQDAGDVEYGVGSYTAYNTALALTGFDPAASGDLLLTGCITQWSFSSFATANNNPTWANTSDSSWLACEWGSASYASDAATGNVTLTATGGSGKMAFAFIAVNPGSSSAPTAPMTPLRGVWG